MQDPPDTSHFSKDTSPPSSSSSSFKQQIVRTVDSLDSPAKKAEFIIGVIAWSLKVIHSPS